MSEPHVGLPSTLQPGRAGLDVPFGSTDGAETPTAPLRRVHQRTVVPALPARLGRFELRRRFGSGSSGTVFEAVDANEGFVAIKLLDEVDEDRVASLQAEYLVTSGLAHPNIVVPFELDSAGGAWFIVMERVEGRPLVEALRENVADSALFAERLLHAALQLVDAVAFLHGVGVVHLDLKPANVLVRPDGSVAVLDFGLAGRATPEDETPDGAPGVVGGTPIYGAPEQFVPGVPGPEADCHALGVLLYEALTGRLPRAAHDPVGVALVAARDLDHASLPAALRPLAALLPRLLAPSPADRAGTAELLRLLRPGGLADPPAMDAPISVPSGPARALLSRIVLSSRGLPISWLASFPGEPIGASHLRALFLERLVTRRWSGGEECLEATSRALRWSATDLPSEEAREAHRDLAVVGDQRRARAEVVASHLVALGDHAAAVDLYARRADGCVKRGAFRQAAELLALALTDAALSDEARVDLGRRRADSLLRAGDSRGAARAYEAVAELLPSRLSRALRSLAASAWLQAGDIARGLEALTNVLRAEGLAPPRRGLAAGVAILAELASLALPVAVRVRATTGRDTAQVDLLWAGGRGLVLVVPETGLELMLRSAVIARRMGEPGRYARVLAFLAMFLLQFPLLRRLGERAVVFAEDTALELGDSGLSASARLWRAGALVYRADWTGLEAGARGALSRLQNVPEAEWERVVATGFVAWALQLRGACAESRALATTALADATARGDRYAQCLFAQYAAFGALAAGDPEDARQLCRTWVLGWETGSYSLADFYGMFLLAHCDLVEGHVERAAASVSEHDPIWHRAGGHRIALWRIDHALLHARILLMGPSEPAALDPIVRRLSKETRPDAPLYAQWLRAARMARAGRVSEAEPIVAAARSGFRGLSMQLYDASLGLAWARLSADPDQATHYRASLRALGVGDPDGWSRVFTPLGRE